MRTAVRNDQRGFTLVEILVSISLFMLISVTFYQLIVASTRSADTTRDVIEVSEEARLGFNRIVRDTREAEKLSAPTPTSYTVNIDFDDDGTNNENPNESGDFEQLTFAYDAAGKRITINGETLIKGVSASSAKPIFSYFSNLLEYDSDQDGQTTWQELDQSTIGNKNGAIDGFEVDKLTSITFALDVKAAKRVTQFVAEAQLRNRR